jgi:hypothetical protein
MSAGSTMQEPTLHIDSEGVAHRASDTAFALLGVGLDEVRAIPRGTLAAEPTDPVQPAARPTWWEPRRRPGAVSVTAIRRPTNERVRVALATRPADVGGLGAALTLVSGAPAASSKVLTIPDVLRAWRAAERLLETVDPGSPEIESALADVAELRAQHHRLFEAQR